MKMKLALVTMSVAALAVAADSQAMIRAAARAKVGSWTAPKKNQVPKPMPKFKAQRIPQITKEILQARIELQAANGMLLKKSELALGSANLALIEYFQIRARVARRDMIFFASSAAGFMSLPYIADLLDSTSEVSLAASCLAVPGAVTAGLLAFSAMNDEAKAKAKILSAKEELTSLSKLQEQSNFKPKC